MVIFLFLLFLPFCLNAQESKISAEIESGDHIEFQPLKGLITITHDKDAKIDLNSFRLEGKPLKVELAQETAVSPTSPLQVSFYRFTLPGTERGLHELPPISVQVGKETFTSVPSGYEVGQLAAGTASSGVVLRFEHIVVGGNTLYPGQRIRLGYRYTYSGSIELTEENLPLLDAKGLLKIGAKTVKDFKKEGMFVREITQQAEGKTPGVFKFGPSSIKGYAYKQDMFGQRQYLEPHVQAGTQGMTITVKPFPEEGKPASFKGAVGPFDTFIVTLLSPPQVTVGDKIQLSVEIGGKGQLENVPLPDFCCQPGFSGQFQQSDLPPVEEMKGPNAKQFLVELRPLSASISQIPLAEFSYFDPQQENYQTLKSEPIPLTVVALPKEEKPAVTKKEKVDTAADHGDVAHNLAPIEIEGIKSLARSDLKNLFLGTWSAFWILPLALVALLIELNYYKARQQRRLQKREKTSRELFEEALRTTTPDFYRKLEKAMMLHLKEQGHIQAALRTASDLPEQGVAGKVRAFLLGIEEKRFTGQEQNLQSVRDEAEKLFQEM